MARCVDSIRSFTFILVGRTATDQRHRLPGTPNARNGPALLTKNFVALHATGIQPVAGCKHRQRVVGLGVLDKLLGGATHFAGGISPLVSVPAWIVPFQFGRDLCRPAGSSDQLGAICGRLFPSEPDNGGREARFVFVFVSRPERHHERPDLESTRIVGSDRLVNQKRGKAED